MTGFAMSGKTCIMAWTGRGYAQLPGTACSFEPVMSSFRSGAKSASKRLRVAVCVVTAGSDGRRRYACYRNGKSVPKPPHSGALGRTKRKTRRR